jgi:hypothetical protein
MIQSGFSVNWLKHFPMKKLYILTIFVMSNFMLLNAQKEMGFVENKGQIADHNGNPLPEVLFQSTGTGPQIFITTSGLTYVFHQRKTVAANQDDQNYDVNWSKIEMHIEGASIKKENVIMENRLPGVSNFYYANCPQGILDVVSYHNVTIKNIYPGIDWVLNADDKKGMSHDFIVHPGADPALIQLNYKGMDLGKLDFDKENRLAFVSPYGTMYEGKLNVYEKESGKAVKAESDMLIGIYGCINVHTHYVPNVTISYELSDYSHSSTLVIDPPLQWDMPQSSSDFDYGYAVAPAKDGSGDILVTGLTDGTDFPLLAPTQGGLSGSEDMIIQRLNSSGTRVWSTYYGGTNVEQGKGIVSDNSGNCYVIGNTGSSNFPVQNAIQASFGGGTNDMAILKFNASGVRQWATWYGSTGNDQGTAITADASGNIYLTGYTNSSAFPTLNAIQSTKDIAYDACILKMNSSAVVQWSTFLGGDDDDKARAITIDAAGTNIYVSGTTISGSFPVTAGVFQSNSASAYNYEDAFVLEMSTAQVVQWSSYCGGSDADFGQGIAVDNSGNVFMTGYTLSSDYPVLNPGSGAFYNGTLGSPVTHDGFVTEINPAGTAKIWSTYFGGTGVDLALGIAYEPGHGIYVCGNSASTDFPTHQPIDNNYYQSVQGDGGNYYDMFISWFGTNDSLMWSTYYGITNSEEANAICVDANNNIFVTGIENNDLALLKFNPGFPLEISTNEMPAGLSVYPVPANQNLFVNYYSENNSEINFSIFNLAGQCVLEENREVVNGNHSYPVNVASLASGIYFLKIYDPSGVEIAKFVKE